MLERLNEIRVEAEAAIAAAGSLDELEALRVRYLGRKADLVQALRRIAELPPDERGPVGKTGNEARSALEALIESRRAELDAVGLEARLAEDRVDVTLPGWPARPAGHLHLINRTRREIEDAFIGLGYRVLEGPEIEWDYYNFTALNTPEGHPARLLQDTFYIQTPFGQALSAAPEGSGSRDPGPTVLRTHTSPMQVRGMESQPPPIYVIVPGKAYRRDHDATHSPMFHQVEGLAVDEDITLADLQGTLLEFSRAIFGAEREIRLRPHYFPFTEPSIEADVSCFACDGSGTLGDGSRDPLCKGSGWLEMLGAGMVDPNLYGFVAENGYDPERIQGFAFGMGIERIAMLKHGIPDLRLLFENDVRFLRQFA
jgi:phenylalanyl-tRNA synthetase alpha chain